MTKTNNSCPRIGDLFTWYVLEDLDAFVHGLEGLADLLLALLGVDAGQRVVHPALVPLEPVRGGDPEILEGLKVSDKLAEFVILKWMQNVRENQTTNKQTHTLFSSHNVNGYGQG